MDDIIIEPSEREERFKKALFNHQIDPTGAMLLPGFPEKCEGADECCDGCDYYLTCFPGE